MNIRTAKCDDSEQIRQIYNHEVLNSMATLDLIPRSELAQRVWMDEHQGVHTVIVATEGDQVIGFASISPYRPRPGYSSTVENSIYVHKDHRGKHVGTKLLLALIDEAGRLGFHSIIARVVATQSSSIELHRRCRFEVIGVEREVGRKFGQWIDIALLQLLL
ncbi:phosphinothricin acetyltransferase [Ferrithrix thermotolerans DSM 19514]|uniref:Phosphinothricin acetyltransferase n=1 Tax=Ferrithrix thermotolerans DSM 19514 TaxID=1121881 RepID=A0A1M4SR13_9ACTN|nr:GNAT family N-acetyltransferase [Ferrithrix thermotolerans]SHE34619.1 phosphinothricin acetyltransferase [Ferrithrix thermotolerans DSM 19514]